MFKTIRWPGSTATIARTVGGTSAYLGGIVVLLYPLFEVFRAAH